MVLPNNPFLVFPLDHHSRSLIDSHLNQFHEGVLLAILFSQTSSAATFLEVLKRPTP
jgi:hypothetical protein